MQMRNGEVWKLRAFVNSVGGCDRCYTKGEDAIPGGVRSFNVAVNGLAKYPQTKNMSFEVWCLSLDRTGSRSHYRRDVLARDHHAFCLRLGVWNKMRSCTRESDRERESGRDPFPSPADRERGRIHTGTISALTHGQATSLSLRY